MKIGDKVKLLNNRIATVIAIDSPVNPGDVYPITVQYIEDNLIVHDILLSDEVEAINKA